MKTLCKFIWGLILFFMGMSFIESYGFGWFTFFHVIVLLGGFNYITESIE